MEINKQQTAKEKGQEFSWFIFLQKKEGKQQVCYFKTSSTSFYNNAYKNSLNSDAIYHVYYHYFTTGDWGFFRSAPTACVPRSEKSFPA